MQSDASQRKYYRSTVKENRFLVMDSSGEKKVIKKFIKISDWLQKKGYSTLIFFTRIQ